MAEQTITVSPNELKIYAKRTIEQKLVPYITSSPGMGKSSLVQEIADEGNLMLIDVRLAQCTPEDLNGFPMRVGDKAQFVPFDIFPIVGDKLPEGKNGWLIFLDELSSAPKSVQAAAYKLILDRKVGSFPLHNDVYMVGAGNKAGDKAVVTKMSTALASRIIHFELELQIDQWLAWATEQELDHRILAYINYNNSALMDFEPDNITTTFPCPRTWEFLSKLIKGTKVSNDVLPLVVGTIGAGTGIEFIQFAQIFGSLPSLADIIAKPKSISVPTEGSIRYATLFMLIDKIDSSNIDPILDYIERYPTEFKIIFSKGVNSKNMELRKTSKKFTNFLLKMITYLETS
ncbi:MAG: hypothetical protein COA63_014275 [Methylophaga sp.]|nr:hypothetical protein [Methylophaga sp.]